MNQFTQQQIRTDSDLLEAQDQDLEKSVKQNSQPDSKSPISKKKKLYLIAAFIFILIISVIIGITLGLYLKTNNKQSEQNQLDENHDQLQRIPKNFKQYEEIIMAGQEGNVVKMIYIPKNQKIYEYVIESNSTIIASSDSKEIVVNSKLIHQFGLLCSNINKNEFEIYLYFINSSTYQDGKLMNEEIGFPGLWELNNKEKRFLDDKQIDEIQNKNVANEAIDEILNEETEEQQQFEVNQFERKILEEHNVPLNQYYTSYYPIIKINLSKDGSINRINTPINLRNDLQKVYLNILEQVFPVLKQEFYDDKNTNSSENNQGSKKKYQEQSLNSEGVIEPTLQANIASNMNATLSKNYTTHSKNIQSETQKHETSYNQEQSTENGVLVKVKTQSNLILSEEKKIDQNDQQSVSNIGMSSTTLLSLQKQEENVPESFMTLLMNTHSQMTLLNITHTKAIESHINIFGSTSSKIENNSNNNVDTTDPLNPGGRRNLQIDQYTYKKMGQDIYQSIGNSYFMGTYYSIDMQQSCQYSTNLQYSDDCVNKILFKLNGMTTEILSIKNYYDFSKYQKRYNYLQYIVSQLIDKLEAQVKQDQFQFMNNFNQLFQSIDSTFVQKKLILQELNGVIDKIDFGVLKDMRSFSNSLNMISLKIQNYYSNLFNELSDTILSFLIQKDQYFKFSLQNFQENVVLELQNIKKELDKNDKIQKYQSDDLISFIQNMENIINLQFQTPLKDIYNRIETLIQEQSYLLYANFLDLVQDQLNSSSLKDQQKLSSLQLIIQAGFDQKISEFISQQLKQIKHVRNSLVSSVNDILKNLKPLTDAISSKIKIAINNEDISKNNSIGNSLQILNSIYDKQFEFQFEIESIHSEIQILFDTFYYLNKLVATTILEDAKQQIENFNQAYNQSIDKTMLYTDFDIFKEKLSNQEKLINTMVVDVEKRTNDVINQAGTFQEQITYPVKHISYNTEKSLFENIDEITQKINNLSNRAAEKQKYEKLIEQLKQLSSPDEINTLNLKYKDNIIIPLYGMQENPESFWQVLQKNDKNSDTSDKIRNSLIQQFHSNYNKAKDNLIAKANSLNVWYSQDSIKKKMINFVDTYNYIMNKDILIDLGEKETRSDPYLVTYHQVNYPTPIMSLGFQLKLMWEISIKTTTKFKNGKFELTTRISPIVELKVNFDNFLLSLYAAGWLMNSSVDIKLRYRYNYNNDQSFKGYVGVIRRYDQYQQLVAFYIKIVSKKTETKCEPKDKVGKTNNIIKENIKNFMQNYNSIVHGYNPIQCFKITTTTTTPVKILDQNIKVCKNEQTLYEKEL